MSCKNKKNLEVITDFPTKGTILQQFQKYLEKHKKVSDIIDFLSIQNARMICQAEKGVSEQLKDELIEFYQYFITNFDELTYSARIENWGMEPLVLRMADHFLYERHQQLREQYLAELPISVAMEAKFLCDTLFRIRKYRFFSFFVDDDIYTLELKKSIYREELEDAKQELFYLCAKMIASYGVVVVRCIDGKQQEIFGIRTSDTGIWDPVPKEQMLDAHTLAPDGTRLEPEDGVIYTQIEREMGPIPIVTGRKSRKKKL